MEIDVVPGGGELVRGQRDVGQQQLPGAAVEGHRGQARHVAVEGADLPVMGVLPAGPVYAVELHQLQVEDGLDGGQRQDVGVVHGHVHPRGEQDQPVGQGQALVAPVFGQAQRQPAAGGVAHQRDAAVGVLVQQVPVQRGQVSVGVGIGGEGREAVGRGHHRAVRLRGQPVHEPPLVGVEGVDVRAAVQVQRDHVPGRVAVEHEHLRAVAVGRLDRHAEFEVVGQGVGLLALVALGLQPGDLLLRRAGICVAAAQHDLVDRRPQRAPVDGVGQQGRQNAQRDHGAGQDDGDPYQLLLHRAPFLSFLNISPVYSAWLSNSS